MWSSPHIILFPHSFTPLLPVAPFPLPVAPFPHQHHPIPTCTAPSHHTLPLPTELFPYLQQPSPTYNSSPTYCNISPPTPHTSNIAPTELPSAEPFQLLHLPTPPTYSTYPHSTYLTYSTSLYPYTLPPPTCSIHLQSVPLSSHLHHSPPPTYCTLSSAVFFPHLPLRFLHHPSPHIAPSTLLPTKALSSNLLYHLLFQSKNS